MRTAAVVSSDRMPKKPTPVATEKPRMGRPRRTAEASDERITFRVTTAELELLTRAAGDLPVGDFIRDAALAAAREALR